MAARTLLRYIELKSGHNDNGPAWIARVRTSKTGSCVYFNGRALMRAEGSRHMDVESREIYWVSGVKKDGSDRHWAGGGRVAIERGVVAEYLAHTGAAALDTRRLAVIDDLPRTDAARFYERANRPMTPEEQELTLEEYKALRGFMDAFLSVK